MDLKTELQKVKCILLIDDDDVNNTLNKLLFKKLDITDHLLIARNGKIGIDMIKERCENHLDCPSLIFLDINMPVMNGFEFIKAYEKEDIQGKSSVIIVMLTTSVNPKDVEDSKHPSITGFLSKPLTEQKIRDVLKDYFSSR